MTLQEHLVAQLEEYSQVHGFRNNIEVGSKDLPYKICIEFFHSEDQAGIFKLYQDGSSEVIKLLDLDTEM